MIKQKISGLIDKSLSFLENWIIENRGLSLRNFYGETFSLLSLYKRGLLTDEIKRLLLDDYDQKDKSDSQFHWEFNNYALLEYYNLSNDEDVLKFIQPLKFKNTPCTNWTLLRSNVRFRAKFDVKLARKESKEKISNFQKRSGLILDDNGVKSFQYHCFSCAMIAEIYLSTKDEFYLRSFKKGVEFIKNFILPNGEALYIGRGQNQSFGYGVLSYILSIDYTLFKDADSLNLLDRVVEYIRKFQDEKGLIPLVVDGDESHIIQEKGFPNSSGWYPYNNYFDYFPFLQYFLVKSLEQLSISKFQTQLNRKECIDKGYQDNDFKKVVGGKYIAVISKPGGYLTNDLPIPYIYGIGVGGVTPNYGGEQYQGDYYNSKGIPLPYFPLINKSIRDLSVSFFLFNRLWVISLFGLLVRRFTFGNDYVRINDTVLSYLKYLNLFLIEESAQQKNNNIETKHLEINFNKSYSCDGTALCSKGKLKRFVSKGIFTTLIIKFK